MEVNSSQQNWTALLCAVLPTSLHWLHPQNMWIITVSYCTPSLALSTLCGHGAWNVLTSASQSKVMEPWPILLLFLQDWIPCIAIPLPQSELTKYSSFNIWLITFVCIAMGHIPLIHSFDSFDSRNNIMLTSDCISIWINIAALFLQDNIAMKFKSLMYCIGKVLPTQQPLHSMLFCLEAGKQQARTYCTPCRAKPPAEYCHYAKTHYA